MIIFVSSIQYNRTSSPLTLANKFYWMLKVSTFSLINFKITPPAMFLIAVLSMILGQLRVILNNQLQLSLKVYNIFKEIHDRVSEGDLEGRRGGDWERREIRREGEEGSYGGKERVGKERIGREGEGGDL